MQTSSSNLIATAGYVLAINLNLFKNQPGSFAPSSPETFRKAMKMSKQLFQSVLFNDFGKAKTAAITFPSLFELSAPIVTEMEKDKFFLENGILIIGDTWIERGATFTFVDGSVISDKYKEVHTIPAEIVERRFDTYNGETLGNIGRNVITALGLEDVIDIDDLSYAYPPYFNSKSDEELCDLKMVKYHAVNVLGVYKPGVVNLLYKCVESCDHFKQRGILVESTVPPYNPVRQNVEFETGEIGATAYTRGNLHNKYFTYDNYMLQYLGGSEFGFVAVEVISDINNSDGRHDVFGNIFKNNEDALANIERFKSYGTYGVVLDKMDAVINGIN